MPVWKRQIRAIQNGLPKWFKNGRAIQISLNDVHFKFATQRSIQNWPVGVQLKWPTNWTARQWSLYHNKAIKVITLQNNPYTWFQLGTNFQRTIWNSQLGIVQKKSTCNIKSGCISKLAIRSAFTNPGSLLFFGFRLKRLAGDKREHSWCVWFCFRAMARWPGLAPALFCQELFDNTVF